MIVTISRNDILALRAILQFYGARLMQNKISPAKRSGEMAILQTLAFKLSYAGSMILMVEELEVIKAALGVFIAEVERRVPGSPRRDEVLVSCEQLLYSMHASFAV